MNSKREGTHRTVYILIRKLKTGLLIEGVYSTRKAANESRKILREHALDKTTVFLIRAYDVED